MATNSHGTCPHCGADLNGGSIWQTGLEFARAGKHYEQHGTPCTDEAECERLADKYAEAYGATRTSGQWGRQIGIEGNRDRIEYWRCPDCNGEWGR
jgi:hypothetical protein